jgi:phosphatidylglycerol lysyltransferase
MFEIALPYVSNGSYFYMLLTFLLSTGIVIKLKRTEKRSFIYKNNSDQVRHFIKQCGGNQLSHLILLNDKKIFWAEQGQVLISYKKIANKYVVLGDPIGHKNSITKAIKEFEMYCNENKVIPVFYQVSPRFLSEYEKNGYRFFKLGEEAKVKLEDFSIAGKQGAKIRTRRNKFERKGYQFHVIQPPFSEKLLNEMEEVSNSWLGSRKEKGFSVSFFSKNYVSLFPTAFLRCPEGKLIAFATLARDYIKGKETVSIDLMRHIESSPHGTMDVLFTSIFLWAQEEDYKVCSLGMTPLSNVGEHKNSLPSEKAARFIFLHSKFAYKFKGLKEFKSKFAHEWEEKYLAYKKTSLSVLVIQLILLIHNKQLNKVKNVTVEKDWKRKKVG